MVVKIEKNRINIDLFCIKKRDEQKIAGHLRKESNRQKSPLKLSPITFS